MYCPICKAEYREGFTVCADCGVALVPTLPKNPELDPVLFFETEGEYAWELPALLHRAGVDCYLYGGDGCFIRIEPEQAVPGKLYVDRRALPTARRCLDLLTGPPIPVDEEDPEENYIAYVSSAEPDPETEVSGDAAWKIFLTLSFFAIGCVIALIFMR